MGYGCTTCIGNSGPLAEGISEAVNEHKLAVAAVLSGNRNFEGRVHQDVRMNYLASPPLVVAYALAGTVDLDLTHDPIGQGSDGKPVYLRDLWPTSKEVLACVSCSLDASMFRASYANVFEGDARWRQLSVPKGDAYAWDGKSTYVQKPPYFEGMTQTPPGLHAVEGARCLALARGFDHHRSHLARGRHQEATSPAGAYLIAHGVQKADFNSYGSRRGLTTRS